MGYSGRHSYRDSGTVSDNLDYQNRSSNDLKTNKSNKKKWWIIIGVVIALVILITVIVVSIKK